MESDKEIYTDYKGIMSQQEEFLKNIRKKINQYQQDSKNGLNTISTETDIEKDIRQYKEKVRELENGYSYRNAPTTLLDEELDRRQKEIQKMSQQINELERTYKNLQDQKYAFKGSINNYEASEEVKDMSNTEIMELDKKKLNDQDNEIQDIIVDVKQGKNIAKEAQQVMKEQDKVLDKMQEDMDRLDSRFQSGIKRFQRYAAKASTCCLIVILVLEIVGAGLILFLIE